MAFSFQLQKASRYLAFPALCLLTATVNDLLTVTGTARVLAGGNYSARVDTSARGELGELATSFNEMAARLEQDVDELRQQEQRLQEEAERKLKAALAKEQLDKEASERRMQELLEAQRAQAEQAAQAQAQAAAQAQAQAQVVPAAPQEASASPAVADGMPPPPPPAPNAPLAPLPPPPAPLAPAAPAVLRKVEVGDQPPPEPQWVPEDLLVPVGEEQLRASLVLHAGGPHEEWVNIKYEDRMRLLVTLNTGNKFVAEHLDNEAERTLVTKFALALAAAEGQVRLVFEDEHVADIFEGFHCGTLRDWSPGGKSTFRGAAIMNEC